MKKPHRRAHLLLWIVLAPIVAIAFAKALKLRPDAPFNESAPEVTTDFNPAESL